MNSLRNIKAGKPTCYSTAIALIAVFFLWGSSLNVFAQAKVRDSTPLLPSNSAPAGGEQQNNYSAFNELQLLKQEVLELRGLVEEQAYQMNRLKQQRLDDYLDLDKRIAELSGTPAGTSSVQSNPGSSTGNSNAVSDSPRLPALSPSPLNVQADNSEKEQALYRDAIDQLLNKQDYNAAQSNFNQYLQEFPSGKHVPNVHYWQGQIYLTENNKQAAEQSFSSLVLNYPANSKVPDAKYKLATILFDQGKKSEAKQLLDDVVSSNTDASRLAKAFIANQY